MRIQQLRSAISAIQEYSQTIPDLNHGGCGVFALLVGRFLSELGFEVHARGMRYEYEKQAQTIEKARANNPLNGYDWKKELGWISINRHIVLEVKHRGRSYFFDSDGFGSKKDFQEKKQKFACGGMDCLVEGRFNLKELEVLVASLDWNPMFDRKTQYEKIEQFLENMPK